MLNIGGGEIALIIVVALLLLGPKRLPEMARVIGKFVREFRRQTDDVRGLVEREFYRMDEEVVKPLENRLSADALPPNATPPVVAEDPADPRLHPDHPDNYKDEAPVTIPPPETPAAPTAAVKTELEVPVAAPVPTAVSREKLKEQQKAVPETSADPVLPANAEKVSS